MKIVVKFRNVILMWMCMSLKQPILLQISDVYMPDVAEWEPKPRLIFFLQKLDTYVSENQNTENNIREPIKTIIFLSCRLVTN